MSESAPSRFRDPAFALMWSVILAVVVHLDWHVGRPAEWQYSLGFGLHWLLGLALGLWMARSFVKKLGFAKGARWLLAAALFGFFVGQVVQPGLESIAYGVPFSEVNSPLRWSIFGEFAIAWLAGALLVLALRRRGERIVSRTDPLA